MPTIAQISTEVLAILQDGSYTATDVLALCNRCIGEVSGLLLLPDLQTVASVSTDTDNHITISGYQRNLRYAFNATHNTAIKIFGSVSQMMDQFSIPDQSGRVICCAMKGSDLYYQRIPESAESLTIHYWAAPTALTLTTDTPSVIPSHLQYDILVNYCCRRLFERVEDGVSDKRENTMMYRGLYLEALSALAAFIGTEQNLPVHPEDMLQFGSYAT